MIKNIFLLVFTLVFSLVANAQRVPDSRMITPEEVVNWSYSAQATAQNEYDIYLTATVQKGWCIYSQFLAKGGPRPTVLNFDKISGLTLVGEATETSEHTKNGFDPIFKMNIKKFYDKVVFVQHIRTTAAIKNIAGAIDFMTCNDKACLPPTEIRFLIPLAASKTAAPIAQIAPPIRRAKAKIYKPRALTDGTTAEVQWSLEPSRAAQPNTAVVKARIPSGWYILSTLENDPSYPATTLTAPDESSAIWMEMGSRKFLADANFENDKLARLEGEVVFSTTLTAPLKPNTGVTLAYTLCNENGCLPRITETVSSAQKPEMLLAQVGDSTQKTDTIATAVENDCASKFTIVKEEEKAASFWWIFIQGFLAGLVALFTPCVFPLLPLTVTFFIKRSKTRSEGIRNAWIYGGSIVFIYLLIGIGFTALLGPSFGSQLSTHWIPNLLFFVIFTLFAISFFGYFELTLPSSWSTSTDTQADRGGLVGIFFMAATLVIVSFSCTGPFLGTILVQAFTGKDSILLPGNIPLNPIMGMLGFSLALAIPFGFFAMFPSLLKSLPKSGGWMTTLKVFFGFVELALAIKFLSNIDLVYQVGLLRWEPFLISWVLISVLAGAYMLGWFVFKADQKEASISSVRKILGVLWFALAGYMSYGLVTYQPLNLLSGMPPPVNYNYFNPSARSVANKAAAKKDEECPLDIECFRNDLEGAIEASVASGKPIFLDFTGFACVNCRKMENNVWVLPNIKPILTNDYILTSLYTDDRTELDAKDICISRLDGKEKATIGKRLLDIQATHFNANSQPFYVLLKPDPKNPYTLRLLNTPVGYTPDAAEFEKFLKEGLAKSK